MFSLFKKKKLYEEICEDAGIALSDGLLAGSVALVMWSQQKLRCRLFRLPANRTVPQVRSRHLPDVDIALFVSYELTQCRPESSVPAETI